jgi:hypothetical protein
MVMVMTITGCGEGYEETSGEGVDMSMVFSIVLLMSMETVEVIGSW